MKRFNITYKKFHDKAVNDAANALKKAYGSDANIEVNLHKKTGIDIIVDGTKINVRTTMPSESSISLMYEQGSLDIDADIQIYNVIPLNTVFIFNYSQIRSYIEGEMKRKKRDTKSWYISDYSLPCFMLNADIAKELSFGVFGSSNFNGMDLKKIISDLKNL